MQLSALLNDMTFVVLCGNVDISIHHIEIHSKQVSEGDLFLCIRGMTVDGHDYIIDAVSRGAAAVIVEEGAVLPDFQGFLKNTCGNILESSQQRSLAVIAVKNTRKTLADISARFYNYPQRELIMIGITGTKGKTTTAYMIQAVLSRAGYKTGLMGTIACETGKRSIPSDRTTMESLQIHRYLREMADNGCTHVVMEVSSQGLKLDRVRGLQFDYAVFTNMGFDHISAKEHQSFNEYLSCKARLFKMAATGIGNKDDDCYDRIFEGAHCRLVSYGCRFTADYKAENIMLTAGEDVLGTLFSVNGFQYQTAIPGDFSVHNALAAIAVGRLCKISEETIAAALCRVVVRGRVEIVPGILKRRVLIDYAHNAMSLESMLKTLRRYHPHRLIVLFGCGGERAKSRRFQMGCTAGRNADYTVITSDNSRDEPAEKIIAEIVQGIRETDGLYEVVKDRRAAIFRALDLAGPEDMVVLAGKGHEMTQETNGVKTTFDERRIVQEWAVQREA